MPVVLQREAPTFCAINIMWSQRGDQRCERQKCRSPICYHDVYGWSVNLERILEAQALHGNLWTFYCELVTSNFAEACSHHPICTANGGSATGSVLWACVGRICRDTATGASILKRSRSLWDRRCCFASLATVPSAHLQMATPSLSATNISACGIRGRSLLSITKSDVGIRRRFALPCSNT